MNSKFDWSLRKVGLGPMESYTDSCFRQIARSFGADFVFTEMIPAEGLVRRLKPIFLKLKFKKRERPLVAQLIGRKGKVLAEAAEILEKEIKVDAIDLNFACPVKNVLKQKMGGFLLREVKELLSLLGIVRRKTTLPLSLKTRSGFSSKKEILKWAGELNKTGVDALILHPRTVKQKFGGRADWNLFNLVKQKLSIPLIATGDIFSQKDLARLFLKAKPNGALVARGALGNPWIFENLDLIKENPQRFLNGRGWQKAEPLLAERKKVIKEHFSLAQELYGENAWFYFRPHIFWYLKFFSGSKKWRIRFGKVKDTSEAKKLIKELCKPE